MTVEIPYVTRRLANGLDVIVHEDHGCPIVAISVWYHVGSKNEQPGRTGLAHLFEHLMFEGSAHHDSGYFRPLQEVGGALNGSTNADRTNYWEVLPRGAVERALWLESDRMGYLLPALTEAKFVTQRNVVLNERRQNYENRPYGFASMALLGAVYAPSHPYHWPTIGAPADLEAATLEDVRAFFSAHYHPGTASLAIAGDIDADEAFALAGQCFEEIPPGPAPVAVAPPDLPAMSSSKSLCLEDRVELPRIYLAWPTPPLFGPGDADLDLLSDVLAGGKSSRLHRALLHDRQLATDVAAGQESREIAGLFTIAATAAPGATLTDIESVVADEIDRLAVDGPSEDELVRAGARVESGFAHRRQSVGGFGGKADQLNAYNVYVGTPGYFAADLERYTRAGIADVRAAAATHLASAARVALSVVPTGSAAAALPGSTPVTTS